MVSVAHLIVNGETIDPGRIREEASAISQLLADQMPGEDPLARQIRAREWAEENLIEDALINQTASSDPVLGSLEAPLRRERLIEKITADVTSPRRTEMLTFYRANLQFFRIPEMVHAAHIVRNIDEQNDESSARHAIKQAAAELARGRPFSEVADELSDCAGNGGDLGFFPRGQMVDAFDEVVFRLPPGRVSAIFRTEFGFHIAKVLEKRAAGIQPFELVRDEIERRLLAEKRQAALNRFVDDLRGKADIRRVQGAGVR
jgi:hypothetical protein